MTCDVCGTLMKFCRGQKDTDPKEHDEAKYPYRLLPVESKYVCPSCGNVLSAKDIEER